MPTPNKQTIAQKDRARRAVELKIAGATWPQIAEELDMKTEAGPRLLVARYFELTAKTQFEEIRPIVLERCEALWRKAWNKLNQMQANGSIDDWNKAMTQCVNVLQQLSRISGLGNGPTINVNVTSTEDVRRLREQFMELRGIEPQIIDADVIDTPDLNTNGHNGSGDRMNGHNNNASEG